MLRLLPCSLLPLLTLTACGDSVVAVDYLTVINISPSHGAVGVDPSTDVLATFNATLEESSLDGRVTLSDSTGSEVPAVAELSADGNTLALRPDGPLVGGTEYTLTLGAGIVGGYGELLATVSSRFTTGGVGGPVEGELLAVPTVVGECQVGAPLQLDGVASEGPEGVQLSFDWRVIAQPEGEPAQLNGYDQPLAELVVFVEGLYVVGLTVSDGVDTSEEAPLEILCAGAPAP